MQNQANNFEKLQRTLPNAVRMLLPNNDRKAILTKQEAQFITGNKQRTAYSKFNKPERLNAVEFAALVKAFAERGDFTLLNLMLPKGCTVISHNCTCAPNGRLEEESHKLAKKYGALTNAFDSGDYRKASRLMPEVEEALQEVKVEIETKNARIAA